MLAYKFEGRRYDCGSKLGYLEATVDSALKHPEVGRCVLAAFLKERARDAERAALPRRRRAGAKLRPRGAKCFVSQPALSVAIQKLEEELGAPLFERGKSEITVTPVGERIVEQAQRVLEEAARIREIAQAGRNQLVGPLRLGVIYTVAPYLLPDLIPALHERAPQMPLDIEENLTENLEVALEYRPHRRRDRRAAVRAAGRGHRVPVRGAVPGRGAAGAQVGEAQVVAPHELPAEHTILLNVGHCFRDQVLDACPELNRADAQVTRTNSLETVRNMVASGLGISVLPRDALTPKYHSRLVVPVPFAKPAPSRRVALAYRKSFPRPAAIAAIREAVAVLHAPSTAPRVDACGVMRLVRAAAPRRSSEPTM